MTRALLAEALILAWETLSELGRGIAAGLAGLVLAAGTTFLLLGHAEQIAADARG